MLPEKLNRNSLLQQHMPFTCDYQKRKIGGGWLEIQKDKLKASYLWQTYEFDNMSG